VQLLQINRSNVELHSTVRSLLLGPLSASSRNFVVQ